MAEAKRSNLKLSKEQDYNRDVQVTMSTSAEGDALYVTFRCYPEAFTDKTGSQTEVRNELAKVIEARLEKKGIASQHRLADGYIVFSTSDKAAKNTQALYNEAETAIKTITSYTDKGVELKSALKQALEFEKAGNAGKGAVAVEVKTAIGKTEAAAAIKRGVELVMPKAEADKLASVLSTKIATQYPTRPVANPTAEEAKKEGPPMYDPLYKAVHDAVTEKEIPDAGKRHYAVGEIVEALQEAYKGLGTAQSVPVRKRA